MNETNIFDLLCVNLLSKNQIEQVEEYRGSPIGMKIHDQERIDYFLHDGGYRVFIDLLCFHLIPRHTEPEKNAYHLRTHISNIIYISIGELSYENLKEKNLDSLRIEVQNFLAENGAEQS